MQTIKVMRAKDIADALGITVDTFYRRRRDYESDGMPSPISTVGHPRWEPTSMQRWLRRNDPMMPNHPANDIEAPLQPTTDDEFRARFARAYGTR